MDGVLQANRTDRQLKMHEINYIEVLLVWQAGVS